jgi:hypothetical protein
MGLQLSHAQSDANMNRMSRDINIMENVLQEMFKTNWGERSGNIRVRGGAFSFGHMGEINGTYVPGFGVIFTIPSTQPNFVVFGDSDEEDVSYQFEYGENESGKKVTQESVTNNIVEFLRDYGSTMSQLPDNEKVMVIYKSSKYDNRVFSTAGQQLKKRDLIPTISVVASKSDLQAYRSGSISENQFQNQLAISTSDPSEEGPRDLKIMANIFETAFEESDEQTFRISGSVDHLKLDNFGALFSFDARYAQHSEWNFSDIQKSVEILRKNAERMRVEMEKDIRSSVDSVRAIEREKIKKNQQQQKAEITGAYNQFRQQLKEYVVDYGRTLNSLENNQYILVSVTLQSRVDEIPERLDLQVQKSTLSAIDRGDISRQEAINNIQVREY